MAGESSAPGCDYLVIGHLARDLACGQSELGRAGGTALYSAIAARRLGRKPAIVTAFGQDFPLPPDLGEIASSTGPDQRTTTFELCEGPDGRRLRLLARARSLRAADVPMSWREASIVHLAPICGELQPDIFDCLRGGMVVATIQGWLRSFERDGLASPSAARLSALPLEQLSAVVLSDEDLDGSGKPSRRTAKVLDELRSRVPVVGLTHGDRGSTLYYGNRSVEIPAVPANAIDVVGAGDIYATALFVRLAETGDPVKSAYFASCAASLSVEGEGWSRIPDRAAIDRRIRKFPWGE